MVKMMSGFGREADALRKRADGLANDRNRDQPQGIAREFDEFAAIAARSARPATPAPDVTPAGKAILDRTGLSCLTRLYRRSALAVAFLLLAVPAWPAGAGAPPPHPAAECTSQECAVPVAPGFAAEQDSTVPDAKSGRTTDPAAAGSSGLSEDNSIGTSNRPTPRLELPNNDAGVAAPGGG